MKDTHEKFEGICNVPASNAWLWLVNVSHHRNYPEDISLRKRPKSVETSQSNPFILRDDFHIFYAGKQTELAVQKATSFRLDLKSQFIPQLWDKLFWHLKIKEENMSDMLVPDILNVNSCEYPSVNCEITEEDDVNWCTGFWNELMIEKPPR